jgi:hypothetical protein
LIKGAVLSNISVKSEWGRGFGTNGSYDKEIALPPWQIAGGKFFAPLIERYRSSLFFYFVCFHFIKVFATFLDCDTK